MTYPDRIRRRALAGQHHAADEASLNVLRAALDLRSIVMTRLAPHRGPRTPRAAIAAARARLNQLEHILDGRLDDDVNRSPATRPRPQPTETPMTTTTRSRPMMTDRFFRGKARTPPRSPRASLWRFESSHLATGGDRR
jgi:hypothetical protein